MVDENDEKTDDAHLEENNEECGCEDCEQEREIKKTMYLSDLIEQVIVTMTGDLHHSAFIMAYTAGRLIKECELEEEDIDEAYDLGKNVPVEEAEVDAKVVN